MKKITIALSLVLGLFSISATQAQMKIYNNNLVKFGDVNTSPTLTSGMEVAMSSFLFQGKQVKFNIMGAAIEFTNVVAIAGAPALETGESTPSATDAHPNGVISMGPAIRILGVKDKLGLGSSSQPFHSVYATTLYSSTGGTSTISDRRYKTDIKELAPATDKIMNLRPITFNYLEEKDGERSTDPRRLNRVGLIAQELQEVIPEAVYHLEEDDIYTVDYTTLIPFLIKTAQEQQALIENQQLQIEELQMALTPDNAAMVTPTFTSVKPDGNPAETVTAVGNKLWSNVPNPFKQETRIRYALTEDVREAQLCIYDLSGRQLSCHRLNDRGESEFVLRAAALNPGIYLYSLIADGQVVDTHRMVVTE